MIAFRMKKIMKLDPWCELTILKTAKNAGNY